jgi:ribosome-associated heat shock protein Hsp15
VSGERDGQRLDRWLWCARFFKSRTLAAKLCNERKVRINSRIATKASAIVRVDDVLTFPQARTVRVVRIKAMAARRGPAVEAVELYEDLSTPAEKAPETPDGIAVRTPGAGRPTKRQRRAIERLTEEQR